MEIKATTPCYKFRDATPEEQIAKIKEKYTKEEAIKTVEERKRGHWDGGGAYYCSNCNAYSATDVFGGGLDITEQHYCYNCGAIMDGQAICDD
ncbi:hypothetical protein [Segatella sp.]|uniref:hypothetical protein n=1 Tax=Segatella sp. TaxID=2974253 RepID=UPI003AB490A6